MKLISVSIFFLTLFMVAGCDFGEQAKTVDFKNEYFLSVPSFLTPTKDLNNEASLQYQNPLRDLYFIVIDEPKTALKGVLEQYELTEKYRDDLQGYSDLLLDGFAEGSGEVKKNKVSGAPINGLPANVFDIRGTVSGVKVFYKMAIIEGKNNYHQVLTWTAGDKEKDHLERMEKIVKSFRER